MGKIFTVPTGYNFLQSVIDKITDLPSMSDAIIYVPTRRLGKALQAEILRHTDGYPTLMPVIKTLGDGDDIAEMHSILQSETISQPVDGLYRRFWLSDIITRFYAMQGEGISLSMALASADDLGALFDKISMFESSFTKFETLFEDGDYAQHWGYSLAFLKFVYPAWNAHLESKNILDIGQYKSECLNALNTYLKTCDENIFLVGATANYPVISRIMETVACREKGTVLIAGYDTSLTAREQENIAQDATHPMNTLQNFVDSVGVENIETIGSKDNDEKNNDRAHVFKSVFLSAKDTIGWRKNPPPSSGFSNLHFSVSDTIHQESMSIALMMREAVETEGQTCALMTADRRLSRMVISLLKRWNIDVDDSSGQPLSTTPPALFMQLVLQVIEGDFSVQSIADLLKHPHCTLGMELGEFNRTAQGLEIFGLRGYYGVGGIEDIIAHILRQKDNKFTFHSPYRDRADDAIAMLKRLQKLFVPLLQTHASFKDIVRAHIEVCESLSSVDSLWDKDDGNTLADCMSEILTHAGEVSVINISDYATSFTSLLGGKTVRKTIGLHPRLFIWGPLEARLQNVNTMIIGGMNEGILPGKLSVDAWLSRAMAGQVGLPIVDASVGVAGNDFISACNGERVVFSRSAKEDGKQTIPSRWWQRFDAVAKASGFDTLPTLSFNYSDLSIMLDKPTNSEIDAVRISVPMPTPPVSARPTGLSVTNIQTWIEDPYQIYCKHILGLHNSDNLWGTLNPALKGNIFHAVFEEFINNHPEQITSDMLGELIALGRKHFGQLIKIPEVKSFWWITFVKVAELFIQECISRNDNISSVITERKATLAYKTPKGSAFNISGTADRIEVLNDRYSIIVDYKTGSAIGEKKVQSGDAPQLTLEAYMLEKGAFPDVPSYRVEQVEIWECKPNFKVKKYANEKNPLDAIIDTTLAKLNILIDDYAEQSTPYFQEKRTAVYNDYAHLMREKEWGLIDDSEDRDNDSKGNS